jgi:hypothetical protein
MGGVVCGVSTRGRDLITRRDRGHQHERSKTHESHRSSPVRSASSSENKPSSGPAPRAHGHGQRGLEDARRNVDPVGWQLGNAVRDDRAREVDGLAACAVEWEISSARHRVRVSRTPGQARRRRSRCFYVSGAARATSATNRARASFARFGCRSMSGVTVGSSSRLRTASARCHFRASRSRSAWCSLPNMRYVSSTAPPGLLLTRMPGEAAWSPLRGPNARLMRPLNPGPFLSADKA